MPSRPPSHRPSRANTAVHAPIGQIPKSSTQRGYGYRWQKAREGYFRSNPLCVHCEAEGRVIAATDLDHIVPHKGDMNIFWDRSNWQGLCHSHHSMKTATEDGGFGNERR